MKTHGYTNRTTKEQFRMAHVQVTHTLSFADLIGLLALVADRECGELDEITKVGAEKAIRSLLTEDGADVLVDWRTSVDEDFREWAEERARRWWGADFGL